MGGINSGQNLGGDIADGNVYQEKISPSLDKVLSSLDPEFSFIILEAAFPSECTRNRFQSIADTHFVNQDGVMGCRYFYDGKSQRCLMIVQIDSTHHDEWVWKLANLNLPQDILVKFYFSHEQPQQRGNQ